MPVKANLLPEDVTEPDVKKLRRRSTLNLFRTTTGDGKTSTNNNARPTTRSSSRTNPNGMQRAASEDAPRMLSRTINYSQDSEREHTPPQTPKSSTGTTPSRFSLSRFRHASDSQLAARARQQAEEAERDIPPLPAMPTKVPSSQRLRRSDSVEDHMGAPTVMVTAPTLDAGVESSLEKAFGPPLLGRKRSKFHPFSRQKQGDSAESLEPQSARPSMDARRKAENRKSRFGTFGRSKDPFEELRMLASSRLATPSGEESLSASTSQNGGSNITLPLGRKSESSWQSTGDLTPNSPGRPKPQQHSSFTWLPRKNKNRNSLFPLPVHIAPPSDESQTPSEPQTPRASTSAQSISTTDESPAGASPARRIRMAYNQQHVHDVAHGSTPAALAATSIHFAGPGGALPRTNSAQSLRSAHSTPALGLPFAPNRMRSATMDSTSGRSDASHPPTPPLVNGSGRTSTSTNGRTSFSNLVHLRHRFRPSSDPHSPRQGSPGYGSVTPGRESHSNSLSISREAAVLPDREEGETPLQYLARVEKVCPKASIPSILSRKTEDFYHTVMRSFMRKFAYFGDPLDMALRKILMEIDLPKETQQIDRVLSSFADRYHECNPGVFPDPDKAYYMTFSLLLLHSDAFNKSNKRKMTKQDYCRNSSTEGVADDVLECFYDNILYTPFIRVEDDIDIKTMNSRKSRKTKRVLDKAVEQTKTTKEPLDPYTLIFENKLDILRPPLRGVIAVDDPYSYLGTAPAFDKSLLKGMKCGIIQLESERSRPDAFKSQSGIDNPQEANIGIIDLPVQKVGLLWRKDSKKRTARSPWQEWGAILTGAGLYFFKNSHFVKNFISQYEDHVKHHPNGEHLDINLTFKPTIQNWRADFLMPTENGVALHDVGYKKHKNAFVFFRHNNADEVFLADNEAEMNDWLMKLNCQAAFKTYGIRPRGLLGGHYEGQRQRGMRRLESGEAANLQTVQGPTGEVTIQSGKIDVELAQQIREARREQMQAKIKELEDKLADLIRTEREQRREATHLFVLAPIQERTRTQLMHAAGRVSAQLKWSRIEIWRIKSHRDILAMDIEDERIEMQKRNERIEKMSPGKAQKTQSILSQSSTTTAKPKANGVDRLSTAPSIDSPAKSMQSRITVLRPETRTSHRSVSQRSSMMTSGEDDVFQTPPENTPVASPTSPDSPATPSTTTPTSAIHRGSIASAIINRSPLLRPSSPSLASLDSPTISEFKTPMLTDAEAAQQRELGPSPMGLDGAASVSDRPGTATSTETLEHHTADEHATASEHAAPVSAGSPDSKRHVRRSLQRTLRDPTRRGSSKKDTHYSHSSKRSGKNDSVSSSTLAEGAIADGDDHGSEHHGLKRDHGSFTVHGKKASVITFGGDWASMEPAERLKTLARHESQKDIDRSSYHASPLSLSTMPSVSEGNSKRATVDSGFVVGPRRSSVSLRERRAISQNYVSGHGSDGELGTARGLRKFSSSSGPPLFEELKRMGEKEEGNEKRKSAVEEEGEEAESSDDDASEEGEAGEDDVTPRPNKLLPLDAASPNSIRASS